MADLSTLLLLRIPFSLFLMPVFLLAVIGLGDVDPLRTALAFILVHFMLYPASNAFNSYYDRDTSSIGGLRNPPLPKPSLLYVSLALDIAAIGIAIAVAGDWRFALGLFLYGLASKAYSWNRIRFKRKPVFSWLATGFGQGAMTVLMCCEAIRVPVNPWLTSRTILAAALCSVFLLATYPLTQIYQHREDASRGDMTISMLVGIRGTFLLSGIGLALTGIGFSLYWLAFFSLRTALLFPLFFLPASIFFGRWWIRSLRDTGAADYSNTMKMNAAASAGMNVFLLLLASGVI